VPRRRAVTRHNFKQVLPAVAAALRRCEFFAFDCEMTGLFLEGARSEYLDDVQDR
jgi:poly(A)-specific ribonuclease